MTDPKVEVYMTPLKAGKPCNSKMESLGHISIADAHSFLNTVYYSPITDQTCVAAYTQFLDNVIFSNRVAIRTPELHISIAYRNPQCDDKPNVKKCAERIRTGQCRCDTMGPLAEMLSKAKHQNHR